MLWKFTKLLSSAWFTENKWERKGKYLEMITTVCEKNAFSTIFLSLLSCFGTCLSSKQLYCFTDHIHQTSNFIFLTTVVRIVVWINLPGIMRATNLPRLTQLALHIYSKEILAIHREVIDTGWTHQNLQAP